MWDDLNLFYTTNRKWPEAYELQVFLGDLHAAMNTLLTHDLLRSIDKQAAESILNFAMAETLLARLGLTEKRPELYQDLLRAALSSPMENLAQQWLNLFHLFDSFADKDALRSASQKAIKSPLRDFTSLLVRLPYQGPS